MSSTATARTYAPRVPSAERREQLLDAALELMVGEGHGALTIDAVARRVGVARPVVYRLFGDRAGLLGALFEREEARALSQLAAAIPAIPGDQHPDDLLVDGLRLFLEAVRESPQTWRLVLIDLDRAPPELRAVVARRREIVREQLERLVAWGAERRGGPKDLDTEVFAGMIQVIAEHAATLVITDPDRYPVDRFLAFAKTMLAAIEQGAGDTDLPPPQLELDGT
ncbi:MAG: TetR/AcrR family transcriptional regulator [Solirubrobacterales bacterium]